MFFSEISRRTLRFAYTLANYQTKVPRLECVRRNHWIPPNQYDFRGRTQLRPGNMLVQRWEVWPLVIVTGVAIGACILSILSAFRHKVDCVYKAHSRQNISRTMDLRCPEAHKLILVTQRYEPWPEMQDVLDKMKAAESKIVKKVAICSFAK